MVRAVAAWILKPFGFLLVRIDEWNAAIKTAEGLVDYARRSGALSHPARINARRRVIEDAEAIVNQLT